MLVRRRAMSFPHEEHRRAAPAQIRFAFVTVSTSRYNARRRGEVVDDESLQAAVKALSEKGYPIVKYELIPDSPRHILRVLADLAEREDVDVIVFSGGTGPAPSDVTVSTLKPLFEKELEGFGDLMRFLSFFDVSSAAFLSSATAGIIRGKLVFALPGSPRAVERALRSLIIPEVGHALAVVRRG